MLVKRDDKDVSDFGVWLLPPLIPMTYIGEHVCLSMCPLSKVGIKSSRGHHTHDSRVGHSFIVQHVEDDFDQDDDVEIATNVSEAADGDFVGDKVVDLRVFMCGGKG